jgi:glycosyltransferase involved in cell wall biosynthesis
MKVLLVNHSDSLGGASVVTYRLMLALRDAGVDARMLVSRRSTDNQYVEVAASPRAVKAGFLAEALTNFAGCRSRANLFKVDSATFGLPLHRHPLVKQADVVILNWVNQGMLSLREIERIDKPVIWTMHDLWCATGVCHHVEQCDSYKRSCGNCPLVTLPYSSDISHSTFRRKQRLYANKDITFVAVSNWLAERCRESALLHNAHIETIPNAFPIEQFPLDATLTRAQLGLPEGRKLIVMGAARLDAPIKGFDIAIDALNEFSNRVEAKDAIAVFYGEIRRPELLDSLRMPHIHLGTISDRTRLASLYAHATAVISTSHYETLPGTLIEGQAAGCFPIAFDRGGQRDIITSPEVGWLAEYPSAQSIADGISHAMATQIDRTALRQNVITNFSAPAIAKRYIDLILEKV